MATAKDIRVAPISSKDANAVIKKFHYSGKVVNNSQLHFGVFLNGRCEGAMQFGPPMMKKNVLGLVRNTAWNGMLELNRMAFGPALPKNSESRALAVAMRIIRKSYPHIEWVLSFSDGTQCGDGTIYRAAGFVLTAIRENTGIWRMPDGTIQTRMTLTKGKHILNNGGRASEPEGATPLSGFQLRYIYFLNHDARKRLTVPEIPFSKIQELGAGMYLGKPRATSKDSVAVPFQGTEGGANPTVALHFSNAQQERNRNGESESA